MFPFLILLVPILIVGWLVLFFKGKRQGLALSFLSFCAAVASGFWAIMQSRASTAGIGVIFLPFCGTACGFLAWSFERLRRHSQKIYRLGAWFFLTANVFLICLNIYGGFKERKKNHERDQSFAQETQRINGNKQSILELLRVHKGHEEGVLEAEIRSHLADRTFIIPALETSYVSEKVLDELSRSTDSGIVLMVARNKRTPAKTLENIYRTSSYPNIYFGDLALNENTPTEILRELFSNPRGMGLLERKLAQNASTPPDILQKLSESDDIWVLRFLLQNRKLDCSLLQRVKRKMDEIKPSDIAVENSYKLQIQSLLEPKLCSNK